MTQAEIVPLDTRDWRNPLSGNCVVLELGFRRMKVIIINVLEDMVYASRG